jgi:hypothetical protein
MRSWMAVFVCELTQTIRQSGFCRREWAAAGVKSGEAA